MIALKAVGIYFAMYISFILLWFLILPAKNPPHKLFGFLSGLVALAYFSLFRKKNKVA